MAGFEIETFIPRPPEAVFDYATDPANAGSIVEDVVSLEVLGDGPVSAGTRMRETREVHGRRATTELEVVEHERPRRHSVAADVSNIHVLYSYRFDPEGEGTRVALRCEVVGRGVKRMMAPVVAAVMKRQDRNHLDRLRAALS